MSVDIYSKRLGINRCYVIKADGCVMVDTGPSISERAIEILKMRGMKHSKYIHPFEITPIGVTIDSENPILFDDKAK